MPYELREYSDTGGYMLGSLYGGHYPRPEPDSSRGDRIWECQQFTAESTYNLIITELDVYRQGPKYGNGKLDLYLADGNYYPTGDKLASAVILEPEELERTWVVCKWKSPYELQEGVSYCIVVHEDAVRPLSQPQWHYVSWTGGGKAAGKTFSFAFLIQEGSAPPATDLPSSWHSQSIGFAKLFRNYAWVGEEPPPDLPSFPDTRPDDYDPDLIWTPGDWDGDTYVPPEWSEPEGIYVAAGGGRWCQNLVVAGNQKIYYEDYS